MATAPVVLPKQGTSFLLATEALNAMWAWIGANRPDMPITCIIDPRNAASIGLAERHGFREFARSPYQGSEVVLLRRNAS